MDDEIALRIATEAQAHCFVGDQTHFAAVAQTQALPGKIGRGRCDRRSHRFGPRDDRTFNRAQPIDALVAAVRIARLGRLAPRRRQRRLARFPGQHLPGPGHAGQGGRATDDGAANTIPLAENRAAGKCSAHRQFDARDRRQVGHPYLHVDGGLSRFVGAVEKRQQLAIELFDDPPRAPQNGPFHPRQTALYGVARLGLAKFLDQARAAADRGKENGTLLAGLIHRQGHIGNDGLRSEQGIDDIH